MVDDAVVVATRNLDELHICVECVMAVLHGCGIVQIQRLHCCFAFHRRCCRFVLVRGSLTSVFRRWCYCEHGCRCGKKVEVLA
ncbi:hypothetical protein DEO72_LG1g2211 [Vigna unguiculata]|uniref:Uncharacterized protein n=1 Tax=Vigna unguiculata TaxID=3917 RepID=A0A4D6KPR1_VIGUN|nr:hypothetical protein DEO72_LG1g2211 [Vigna unguiculata]